VKPVLEAVEYGDLVVHEENAKSLHPPTPDAV